MAKKKHTPKDIKKEMALFLAGVCVGVLLSVFFQKIVPTKVEQKQNRTTVYIEEEPNPQPTEVREMNYRKLLKESNTPQTEAKTSEIQLKQEITNSNTANKSVTKKPKLSTTNNQKTESTSQESKQGQMSSPSQNGYILVIGPYAKASDARRISGLLNFSGWQTKTKNNHANQQEVHIGPFLSLDEVQRVEQEIKSKNIPNIGNKFFIAKISKINNDSH